MPTTAALVCAGSGDVAVLARTALSVLFCRKHTRPRTLDWSTWCRWWCIEVVARSPGRAERKRGPAVRSPETRAAFALLNRVRKLAEYQQHPFLYTAVWVLFQTALTFHIPGRRRDDQFATFCFLAAPLHRALSQQVQFIFVQTAFQSQQQAIVALSRRVHHFLIDQQRVHYTTDFHQLLPFPT